MRPTTTYLTWDDFTPDADDAEHRHGRGGRRPLVGFGPSPGTSDLTARFTFDPRDRLLSYSGAAGTETYDYIADGMMRSSSTGGDERRFYYDASENPQVDEHAQMPRPIAGRRGSAARASSTTATEQILLPPRKDMACTYDAANADAAVVRLRRVRRQPERRLQRAAPTICTTTRSATPASIAIRSGAATTCGRAGTTPTCRCSCRAIRRQHLNRYGYGNGNPVMNDRPERVRTERLARLSLARLNQRHRRPLRAHLSRAAYRTAADPRLPKQFWQSVKTDKGGIDVFLALGIVSEVAGGYGDAVLAGFTRLGIRYGARFLSDTVLGVSSSVVAGATSGSGHFDWNAFGQGLEYSANPFLMRGFTGFNVRSGFQFSATDAADLFEELRHAPDTTALVFRQRLGTGGSTNSLASLESSTGGLVGGNAGFDKPFTQAVHLSALPRETHCDHQEGAPHERGLQQRRQRGVPELRRSQLRRRQGEARGRAQRGQG